MKTILEIMAILAVLTTILSPLYYWSELPEKVPTHFNFSGEADRFGDKATLLLLPLVSILVYGVLSVIVRYPEAFNYPWRFGADKMARQRELAIMLILCLKTELVWLFALIEWEAINTAFGRSSGLGKAFVPAAIAAIFGTIGYYFGASYRAR
jgi:uncharacterized membrane protein